MASVDKRERLIVAAAEVIHTHGYEGATLALVASEAAVPLGNVYYYFKTKDALGDAVIDARRDELVRLFATIDAKEGATPVQRLRAFVAAFEENAEELVQRGCPFGALSRDLALHAGDLRGRVDVLFEVQIAWATVQFRKLGAKQRARERAIELVSGIQGACLVGLALGDADVLRTTLRSIARRLEDK